MIVKEAKKVLAGLGLVYLLSDQGVVDCGYETDEEKCCDCLVEEGCTDASKERCLDVFYVFQDSDSIKVENECVGKNDCYSPCAVGGAYFEDGRMVVDYWKKKSLE